MKNLFERLNALDYDNLLPADTISTIHEMSKQIDKEIEAINVLDCSDAEVEKIHEHMKTVWKQYADYVYNAQYDFILQKEEVAFIHKHLVSGGVFDVDQLLIAEKLYVEWLQTLEIILKNTEFEHNYPITISQSVMLHTLLKSNVKVKGIMSSDFVIYSALTRRIGSISKIYNSFETIIKDQSIKLTNKLDGLTEENTESVNSELTQTVSADSTAPVFE